MMANPYKNKKIELGDKVRCIYTGYTGIAVTKMEFINKCIQFEIAPKVGKDNKQHDAIFIDIQSLEIIERGEEGKRIDKKAKEIEKEIEKEKINEDTVTGGPNHKHIKMRGH